MSKKTPLSQPAAAAAPRPVAAQSPAIGAPGFDLQERHASVLAGFAQTLQTSRLWHVLPAGETDVAKASGLFDTTTGLCYPPASELQKFLGQHPFVYVRPVGKSDNLATLQTATRLLWNHETSGEQHKLADGQKIVTAGRWAGLEHWALPSKDELYAFATAGGNPHRAGQAYRLADRAGNERCYWLTAAGRCDVDDGCWGVGSSGEGCIFARHSLWQSASPAQMLADLIQHGWQLQPPSGSAFAPHAQWKGLEHEALLARWQSERLHLVAHNRAATVLRPEQLSFTGELSRLDYTPCRLPLLDAGRLSDHEQGLWELWGQSPEALRQFNLVARDPRRDLADNAVAIDFGTSSTVVALDSRSGAHQLLRIGVRDYFEAIKPLHFENPTVLECLDWRAFAAAWAAQAYRPALDWDWMRAAHEAQASYRGTQGDARILGSLLPRLKQWALRASGDRRVRLTDRQGHEVELPLHTERTLVRGQALQVGPDDPFDPIELYAWYLGMAINTRAQGLYLKYYLSFPARYPREVKQRIRASFSRGLQRSLPQTLIASYPEVLNRFEVREWATEPAAYAAAAINRLELEPTTEGLPYAVFDFGGGTTDFDFGLLRLPTPQEERRYEQVFEQLASSGDVHLGGEGLLEHLVYATFQHNLGVLRQERIQFTCPLDAGRFAGSESFVSATQAAQTNTVMLAAQLRPFMEGASAKLDSQIKLELIDTEGRKKSCELLLDAKALDSLLAQRIGDGVRLFLNELARLLPRLPAGAPIHVLLAGNGCQSRHVRALFDTQGSHWPQLLTEVFGEQPPELVVHPPLPVDERNHHAPTGKTGVALGLLRLVPGQNSLLINHVDKAHDGEAPFAWFVGRLRRGRFAPALHPGAAYGQWVELGALQDGVFSLLSSTSLKAHEGLKEGAPELVKRRLEFSAAGVDDVLFARPTGPHTLELATAEDEAALAEYPDIVALKLG